MRASEYTPVARCILMNTANSGLGKTQWETDIVGAAGTTNMLIIAAKNCVGVAAKEIVVRIGTIETDPP